MAAKDLIIVGGPNGAGKTTFAQEFRAGRDYPYLSADLIAAELAAEELSSVEVAAGREFLRRIDNQLTQPVSFLVESTLSGRTFRQTVEQAKQASFGITILFVYLDSADVCVARVKERVQRGGHDVPESDIRRRYLRSLRNFWHLYRPLADCWLLVNNTESGFQNVAIGTGDALSVHDEILFRQFQQRIEKNHE